MASRGFETPLVATAFFYMHVNTNTHTPASLRWVDRVISNIRSDPGRCAGAFTVTLLLSLSFAPDFARRGCARPRAVPRSRAVGLDSSAANMANRGAGLVQRKRAGTATDELPPEKDDFDDDDNLADKYSKEAKLSLMEEVLLLGLKDEEVCIAS